MAVERKTIIATVKADTAQAEKGLGNVKKELKGVADESKGGSFSKLSENLTNISPAANKATQGISGLKTGLDILRANPIIAVITVLVGLVIALFQPFKKMEGVSDSLGKAWGQLSGIFNTFITKILTPLIDGFVYLVDLFTNSVIGILDALGVTSKETAERFGEITEALDDLEDAQKDSAIAMAESNRKLQEAREIASDANVPIKERVAALKEAARIEKEELDKVVKLNQMKAQLTMESIAMELGARQGLIDMIRSGSIEQLKAARAELASMKNVDKEKLYALDAQIIAAEDALAKSAKIGKKTQKEITSLEKEESDKREAIAKEHANKMKAAKDKENAEKLAAEKKFQEDYKKLILDGLKAVEDAKKVLFGQTKEFELAELKKRYDEEIKKAREAGLGTMAIRDAFNKEREALDEKYKKQAEAKEIEEKKLKDEADKVKNEQMTAKGIAANQVAIDRLVGHFAQVKQVEQDAANARIAIEEQLLLQRQQLQEVTNGLLQNASAIFGKETAAGKGIAIAQALINTYAGATDALRAKSTLPSPFDVVAKIANVSAVLATGFKSIKAITAVQVPNAGGASSGATPSIAAPVTPQQASTQLNAASIQGIGNAAAGGINRTFVLESDINNNSERQRRLNRAARLN